MSPNFTEPISANPEALGFLFRKHYLDMITVMEQFYMYIFIPLGLSLLGLVEHFIQAHHLDVSSSVGSGL